MKPRTTYNVIIIPFFLFGFQKEDLVLPGDVGYNVEKLFSNEARMALRLSHFLSNFLQNVDMYEEYGNLRGDNLLNIEQIFGEVGDIFSFISSTSIAHKLVQNRKYFISVSFYMYVRL